LVLAHFILCGPGSSIDHSHSGRLRTATFILSGMGSCIDPFHIGHLHTATAILIDIHGTAAAAAAVSLSCPILRLARLATARG